MTTYCIAIANVAAATTPECAECSGYRIALWARMMRCRVLSYAHEECEWISTAFGDENPQMVGICRGVPVPYDSFTTVGTCQVHPYVIGVSPVVAVKPLVAQRGEGMKKQPQQPFATMIMMSIPNQQYFVKEVSKQFPVEVIVSDLLAVGIVVETNSFQVETNSFHVETNPFSLCVGPTYCHYIYQDEDFITLWTGVSVHSVDYFFNNSPIRTWPSWLHISCFSSTTHHSR